MTFREHMQRIVEAVPGSHSLRPDGISTASPSTATRSAVAASTSPPCSPSTRARPSCCAINNGQPAAGGLTELVISTPILTAVLRPLNEGYFLAVVLGVGGLSGKARYLMRQAAPELLRDLT